MFANTRTFNPDSFARHLGVRESNLRQQAKKKQTVLADSPRNPPSLKTVATDATSAALNNGADAGRKDTSTVRTQPSNLDPLPASSGVQPNSSVRRRRAAAEAPRRDSLIPHLQQRRTKGGGDQDSRHSTIKCSQSRAATRPGSATGRRTPASMGDAGAQRGLRTGASEASKCGDCGRELGNQPRYSCLECSRFVCQSCTINAALLHTDHTLALQTMQDMGASTSQAKLLETAAKPHAGPVQTLGYKCHVCRQRLLRVRYQCTTCPGVNLCDDCLDIHHDDHELEAIGCEEVTGTPQADSSVSEQVEHEAEHGARHEEGGSDNEVEYNDEAGSNEPDAGVDESGDVGGGGDDDQASSHADAARESQGNSDTDAEIIVRQPSPLRGLKRRGRRSRELPSVPNKKRSGRVDDDESDDDLQLGPPRPSRRRQHSPPVLALSRHGLERLMKNVAQAVMESVAPSSSLGYSPRRRHRWYDEEDDDEEGEDERGDYDPDRLLDFNLEHRRRRTSETGSQRKYGTGRRWLSTDKQQLSALKEQGLDDGEIAGRLHRSPSAISQQWRKQSANQK